MVKEFYEAFLEAGVSKERASRAAEVASEFVREDENKIATKEDIRILDAKLNMVQWIVTGVGFGIIILMIESFLR